MTIINELLSAALPAPTIWEVAGMVPIRTDAQGRVHRHNENDEPRQNHEHLAFIDRVLRSLRDTGPAFTQDLANELHMKRNTVNDCLSRLHRRGLVKKGKKVLRDNRYAQLWEAVT